MENIKFNVFLIQSLQTFLSLQRFFTCTASTRVT